ncbi:hypothetical protein LTR91_011619 [Friedmanniomyces endolithicus]|uniref:Uncharacterized protein n=1 Tax=Friedmanniomyces endolithicus TaxID=329885 RepID=A0AAN6FJ14_9PEZI|nr:hypothetical protein LTR35_007678 [Friedmanniomyces endolithicus]KAK0295263.1 hypothetical protein LTS00_006321 [Friedmanniomyces endolithicus]KAK0318645.1 hypothetical protein LTR82_010387 [Friedmanniomyces endolithicus]KAK0915884.1 hypothetical protein LTR57_013203 [Friedmanniomyces endolithicus]KAK0982371.1 hypothetical protein LTR91_011619 [Friedmanniomyces endolithicus]
MQGSGSGAKLSVHGGATTTTTEKLLTSISSDGRAMSSYSPLVTKSTIKQAKADFKARGRPTLSSLEQRQLERSIQLDRRAWGTKEREKRKAEATRKRTIEAGRKEQGEREGKAPRGEDGRRRCDRFGYLSSQLHLGAFLGAGIQIQPRNEATEHAEKVGENAEDRMEEEESFGDSGVDDETLINALASPKANKSDGSEQTRADSAVSVSAPFLAAVPQHLAAEPPRTTTDEPSDFWDELDSSTQIARELASEEPAKPPKSFSHRPAIRTATILPPGVTLASRGAGKAPPKWAPAIERDRVLMPPPMMRPPQRPPRSSRQPRLLRPPFESQETGRPLVRAVGSIPKPAANLTFFTKWELEAFVDEDLQLTQALPG